MFKIILFIVILLIGVLVFVWFKYPRVVRPIVSPILSHITEKKSDSEGFGRETVQEKNNLLMEAKVSAEEGSKKAVEDAKDMIINIH